MAKRIKRAVCLKKKDVNFSVTMNISTLLGIPPPKFCSHNRLCQVIGNRHVQRAQTHTSDCIRSPATALLAT